VLRPFTIQDLGLWQSAKSQAVFLNSQTFLTQGPGAILWGALLSPLSALSGIFTYAEYQSDNGNSVIGQIAHTTGSPIAFCRFLAPEGALNSRSMPSLFEGLLKQIGNRGAHGLVADVEEESPAFNALRQNGFSIYAHQQVWKLIKAPKIIESPSVWRPALLRDELAIQILRNGLVPGQVQQIEVVQQNPEGYVYFRNEQLLAYAEVRRGSHGIWLQPFVSLDAEPFEDATAELLARLRPRTGRPVYVCLRSYQDWLRKPLEKLEAVLGPRQTVMVKHTALPLKAEEVRRVPVANRTAEPTTPIHAPLPRVRRETEWITYDQTPNYR
jgi:hypothetical protein